MLGFFTPEIAGVQRQQRIAQLLLDLHIHRCLVTLAAWPLGTSPFLNQQLPHQADLIDNLVEQ
ncbi:hypothetical protein D9M69_417770 [compost metagenome]